ncbi:hypothetical protein [Rhodopirellula sp. MGV]|uniref:hypothetical protein n=1 Tax=Rhodopirellula sp. MGV TaxID=2023130 RepID=UPI001179AD13|nr:hypothetical protein [Rhodopirellula sp. MGV]
MTPFSLAEQRVDVNCLDSLDGWQNFEMIPEDYRLMRDAKRFYVKWLIGLVLATLLTVGSLLSIWVGRKRLELQNRQILDASQPVEALRGLTSNQVARLAEKQQWLHLVQSAKPDDSLSQVIATLAIATHQSLAESPYAIETRSLSVRLPLENDPDDPKRTATSNGKAEFSVVATVDNRAVISAWKANLKQTDRLHDIQFSTPQIGLSETLVQINATPLSAKLIP